MGFRRVLPSDELPRASGGGGGRLRDRALETTVSHPVVREARVGRTDILLTRLASGEVVAFQASCPHQGISLKGASIFEGRLRCPQHHYLYDPRSGRNVLPTDEAPAAALRRLKPGYLTTYPVEERDGWIWVGEAPRPPPPATTGALPTPAPRRVSSAFRRPDTSPATAEPVEHPTEDLHVPVGANLTLALVTAVRPGHLWHVEVGGPQLAVAGQVFRSGPPPTCEVTLTALAEGHATVRCAYAQPWSGHPREVRTYAVRVTA